MADVLNVYTIPQVYAFVSAANERMDDDFLTSAVAVRIAMAKDKDWRSFLHSRRYHQARRSQKVITPVQAKSLMAFLGGKIGGAK